MRFRNDFESSKFFDEDPVAGASLAGFIVNIRLLLGPAGGDGGGEAARTGSCCALLPLIEVLEAASSWAPNSALSDSSLTFERQHAAAKLMPTR